MKGDIKRDIENGIENVQKKVKGGVERLRSVADQGDRSFSKHFEPNAKSGEPNQQSRPVPKYCPYCGVSLKGLLSCGDVGTSQPPDDEMGNENDQDEESGNERMPQNSQQRSSEQHNIQDEGADDSEDEGIQQGENEDDENNKEGSETPPRSDKLMQKFSSQQSKGRQETPSQKSERKYCPYCASPTTGTAYCPKCGNKVK